MSGYRSTSLLTLHLHCTYTALIFLLLFAPPLFFASFVCRFWTRWMDGEVQSTYSLVQSRSGQVKCSAGQLWTGTVLSRAVQCCVEYFWAVVVKCSTVQCNGGFCLLISLCGSFGQRRWGGWGRTGQFCRIQCSLDSVLIVMETVYWL